MLTTFPLESGDVVVMGSDGLWDNLSEMELLEVIERIFKGNPKVRPGRYYPPHQGFYFLPTSSTPKALAW